MRICHVSTFWPNRSGLTNYVDALISGMRESRPEKHFIAGEHPSAPVDTEAYRCVPCFKMNEQYKESVFRQVESFNADLVVLQYANDLFGEDNRFPGLLAKFKQAGIPAVVNCHSVYPPKWRTGFRPGKNAASFDRAVAEQAACLTVHSQVMRSDLLDRGIDPEKVVVIPHGSLLRDLPDQAESRRSLKVPEDARMVLFFGFIWLGKGLDFLLDAFSRVARRVPEALLYIGGYTRKKVFYNRLYMGYLRARILGLRISRQVRMWGDYVPDEVVPLMYSAADIVALPYRQDYSSVSGVVHQAAGMSRVMLCSRISKFDEVGEGISEDLLVDPKDRNAWAVAMERLLTDREYAEKMRAKVRQFARDTSWEAVGKLHLELYDRLLS